MDGPLEFLGIKQSFTIIHLNKSIRNCKGVCLLLACGQYTIYLPSLLGIVEPSDKKDIIFHHANEMTNSVIFAQIWMACSHIFTFSFDKLFLSVHFSLFQGQKVTNYDSIFIFYPTKFSELFMYIT